ncbi:LLM class flavin-dependent oxidoreductase [Paraburkholderia aromaticivorans]|uniref:LLM class flavin-dependent oxidoreductase n=1 Tax=Paraburkholderia aromaticivorans TaxID=2026199 RepID=UPI001456260B|nr:LLM class flavin-dependent oxidoreductase [Paraburkholderia aromaticivorans]
MHQTVVPFRPQDTAFVSTDLNHFRSSSPLPLLAAVGTRTNKIEIGTGVTDIRYENPLYMAEDAGAADLIAGGRPNGRWRSRAAISSTRHPAPTAHPSGLSTLNAEQNEFFDALNLPTPTPTPCRDKNATLTVAKTMIYTRKCRNRGGSPRRLCVPGGRIRRGCVVCKQLAAASSDDRLASPR